MINRHYQRQMTFPTEDDALNIMASGAYRRVFEDVNYEFTIDCEQMHWSIVRPLQMEFIEMEIGAKGDVVVKMRFMAWVRAS